MLILSQRKLLLKSRFDGADLLMKRRSFNTGGVGKLWKVNILPQVQVSNGPSVGLVKRQTCFRAENFVCTKQPRLPS